MVRHIELTIDFDLTCWAESMEDFENDDMEMINECVADYIIHNSDELLEHLTIKKIWYEEDKQSSFFITRKFSYVSRTKNPKVKFVKLFTKFVNNLLTVRTL